MKALLKEVSENVKGYDVYLGGGYLREEAHKIVIGETNE